MGFEGAATNLGLINWAFRQSTQMEKKLLVATRNLGKVEEFADLLNDLAVEWFSLADVYSDLDVEESGSTFEENAIIKAEAYAKDTGMITIADDSGLEVDYLGGRPGVRTARYGGPDLTPKQRYELLLQELGEVSSDERGARFRCVVAVANHDGLVGTSSGECEGRIAFGPKGSQGFGYDPIFYLPDRGMTMAELSPVEKHQISHRGKAVAGIVPLLRRTLLRYQ
jgi:XTP/dITP diphosphohydrolase